MFEDIAQTTHGEDPQHSEVLQAPGQVVIEAVYLTTRGTDYDLTNFMVGFTLYEDMFSNFLSGEMTIVDAASLITRIKPSGGEMLTIKFRTRQGVTTIGKSFSVYGISGRAPTNTDREQAYAIKFTSLENIINNNVAISKKFAGRTDTIVSSVFTDYLKSPRYIKADAPYGDTPLIVTGGPHTSSTAFIPGFWSPTKALNYVAGFAVGSKGQAPNYLFFETNKNFFFASVEDLIQTQRNQNLIFDTYIYSPSKHVVQDITKFAYQFPEIRKGYSIVRSIGPFDMFDTLQGQDRGYYGSTVRTFDFVLKEWRTFVYNHSDGYQRFNHMQDYAVSGNSVSPSKNKNTRPFGSGIFSGTNARQFFRTKQYDLYPELRDPMYQTWLPQRTSLLNQLNQTKIVIEVPGRSDIEAGRLVNFLYPKMTSGDSFEIDAQVSGLYMVTAVKHAVTRQEYSMTLELTKDSVLEPLV